MKTLFATTLALALSSSVFAQSAPSMTPSEAKTQWESLTPAQQAAFKQKAKNEAQAKQEAWNNLTPEQQAAKKAAAKEQGQAAASAKQDAWNSLTPEEQAAKKAAAQEKAQPYAEQAKTGMAAKRAEHAAVGAGMGAGMHRRR